MKKQPIDFFRSIKRIAYLTILLCLTFVTSCKKETGLKSNDQESKRLILAKKANIPSSAGQGLSSPDFDAFEVLTPFDLQNLTELQAISLTDPFVSSGTSLYNSLILQISGTPEWAALSAEEQNYILNFTPQQKAMLEVIYRAANIEASASGETPRWVHCAVSALGFQQAYSLIAKAFTVGMSASTAVQALRFIGLKYLGYVALAYAIYEFVQCVSDSGPGENPELIEIDISSKLLDGPLPSSTTYLTTAKEVVDASSRVLRFTSIFFNSLDNKYYSDSAFTTFVPDGYYPNVIPMTVPQCHYIVGGVALAVYHRAP
ncbi:hypothetical protein [Pedobacter sp. ASV12]|uniref:hypothetical protein n=1 Tax=Pedobacter sp. ASV12 TaxID=2795120 RepID=UPI0018EE16E1|nr:hypothetical protein [Pedobacter sp. ASV12]